MTELTYPFKPPACNGERIDVVPGCIQWLRMPLPMALNHINLYLVRDGAGWRIIDTGFDTAVTRALWEQILPELGAPITGIVCTHHHGDHCGLAGWLTEKLRVPLYMSRAEYFAMRLVHDTSLDSWEDRVYFRRAGLNDAQVEELGKALQQFTDVHSPPARAYRRLRDGETLVIGDFQWQLRGGEGHSPEHIALYCSELGVLLSGDQLLGRISPNVGVLPFEPEANPLKEWLTSLERIGELPNETLVLPSHELPFHGLRTRAEQLQRHHFSVLDRVLAFCAERPDTVYGLSRRLFPDRRGALDSVLAIGETMAHLAYLLKQRRVQRSLTAADSYEYRVCGA
ncbi:MAG TPA: MBL fold metallo-hydrolase [Steroidobacter sp.]|jgi:glyoxylase-like metal-dependent hydrolase (beta-lactamase superfamily II)|nr:MBL fold metallo-hydrolase [Steroidobacteraceae bacterium]HLS82014.1 MBL fold metallo-hydrolase [Steroidobacter sp.]